jgi:hypothetical protein
VNHSQNVTNRDQCVLRIAAEILLVAAAATFWLFGWWFLSAVLEQP